MGCLLVIVFNCITVAAVGGILWFISGLFRVEMTYLQACGIAFVMLFIHAMGVRRGPDV